MFDLLRESRILINPPVDAVLAGVVWKYCLSWPHLRARECEICISKQIWINLEQNLENIGFACELPFRWYISDFVLQRHNAVCRAYCICWCKNIFLSFSPLFNSISKSICNMSLIKWEASLHNIVQVNNLKEHEYAGVGVESSPEAKTRPMEMSEKQLKYVEVTRNKDQNRAEVCKGK